MTIFSKLYDQAMGPLERQGLGPFRAELIGKATGQVLEVGCGTGANFPYYQQVESVVALEPDPTMRRKSVRKIKGLPYPVNVIPGSAEHLPFPDDSFDTVVGTLVLCTIPDPVKALQEIRRVCKPGGLFLCMEHVRLPDSFLASLQDGLTPIWKRLCDGCRLNRNSLEYIEQAGFEVVRLERHYKDIFIVVEARNGE